MSDRKGKLALTAGPGKLLHSY